MKVFSYDVSGEWYTVHFEKFKLNRNLQTIPFKMMYNMSILRPSVLK